MYSGSAVTVCFIITNPEKWGSGYFFDCGWRSVVFSKTQVMNKSEHYTLYVSQPSLERSYKNRHLELLYSDIADFLIVFFTLILCDVLLSVRISKGKKITRLCGCILHSWRRKVGMYLKLECHIPGLVMFSSHQCFYVCLCVSYWLKGFIYTRETAIWPWNYDLLKLNIPYIHDVIMRHQSQGL